MKLTRISGLVAVALGAAITIAYAAGNFDSYPIVGGAAHCQGSTGTSTATCAVTVPAGPTAVTGNELVPADTTLTQGRPPQTVLLSMKLLRAAPMTYALCAGAVCGTFTIGNNSGGLLLDFASTITSATVNLPLAPVDGQRVSIASPVTITSLSVVAGAGSTLAATTPTVLTASAVAPQGYEFMYVASTTKWYRIS